MSFYDDDKRLHDVLDMIGRVASLDFSVTLKPSQNNDMVDAIAIGLNMLSEELNSSVVEKSKLDEVNSKLERFAYTTAHDLKSPLNTISGIVRLMELTINDEAKRDVGDYLSKLKDTVDKMRSLVQGILDYSKADAQSLEKSEIDLNNVFHEIIETDQALHKVNMKIPEPLPVILFNKSGLYQIVRNLINNAVKYCDKEVCELNVGFRVLEDRYHILVSDNGPGIAHENHETIFRLFNQIGSRSKTDSHGIGLHMIRRILETAGEKIWVESSPGNGATFLFTIKRHQRLKNNSNLA